MLRQDDFPGRPLPCTPSKDPEHAIHSVGNLIISALTFQISTSGICSHLNVNHYAITLQASLSYIHIREQLERHRTATFIRADRKRFRAGLLQADPHAGNLLLQVQPHIISTILIAGCLHIQSGTTPCDIRSAQDDGGVALLDFGQCKALPAARHAALARLIVAIDDGDDVRTALAMSAFGMDFSALGGGVPDPAVIRTVALIIFDTRYV